MSNHRKINYLHSSTRCNVCFEAGVSMFLDDGPIVDHNITPIKLLQCSDCKMISYCGIAHQRIDWKSHKQFCKSVKTILTNEKIKHLYDINEKPIKNATIKERNSVIALILIKMANLMKRNLSNDEYQLIKYPKICSICYEYKTDTLEICTKCKCEIYCRSHAEIFQSEHTQMICDQMKLWHDWCGEDLNCGEQFRIVPEIPSLHCGTTRKPFPRDIFELINGLLHVPISNQPKSLEDFIKFNAVGVFSDIATILYILLQPATQKYFHQHTTLEIHLVGASRELAYLSKNECILFTYWLPEHIQSININLIGPEIEFEDTFEYVFDRKPIVTIKSHKRTYESFIGGMKNDSPHLICCFNSGFSEFDSNYSIYNPWIPALRKILNYQSGSGDCVPIAFTSYVQEEVYDNKRCLETLSFLDDVEIRWIIGGVINPYRHCKPERERDNHKGFYHINNYLSLFISNK